MTYSLNSTNLKCLSISTYLAMRTVITLLCNKEPMFKF